MLAARGRDRWKRCAQAGLATGRSEACRRRARAMATPRCHAATCGQDPRQDFARSRACGLVASRRWCSIICRSSVTGSLSSAALSIAHIVSSWPAAWRSTRVCGAMGEDQPEEAVVGMATVVESPINALDAGLALGPHADRVHRTICSSAVWFDHGHLVLGGAAGAHPGGGSEDRHGVAQERSRDQGQGDGVVEPAWRLAGRHYGGGAGGPTQRRGVRWRQSRRRCHHSAWPNCRSCGVGFGFFRCLVTPEHRQRHLARRLAIHCDPSLRGVVKEQSARESARRGHHHRKSQARGDQQAAGVVFTRDQEWAGPDRAHAARPTDPACRGSSTHASTRRGHRPVGT